MTEPTVIRDFSGSDDEQVWVLAELAAQGCQCVEKHIPKPMELHKHHIWPVSEGGPNTKDNLLVLCPTAHSNIHKLWRLYESYQSRPPWPILRNYSEYARSIVEMGLELRRLSLISR
jgi:hypothetical protein